MSGGTPRVPAAGNSVRSNDVGLSVKTKLLTACLATKRQGHYMTAAFMSLTNPVTPPATPPAG